MEIPLCPLLDLPLEPDEGQVVGVVLARLLLVSGVDVDFANLVWRKT